MTGRHWLVAFSLITGSGVLQVRAGCVADENCQQVLSVSGSSGYCRLRPTNSIAVIGIPTATSVLANATTVPRSAGQPIASAIESADGATSFAAMTGFVEAGRT